MTAEIICVGTEILLGNIVNTNAAYLSERLASLGISVFFETTVGDNEERLEDVIRQGFERSDILILSGGLGPTKDDLTKEVATKVCGQKLVEDEEALRRLKEYFASSHRSMTPAPPCLFLQNAPFRRVFCRKILALFPFLWYATHVSKVLTGSGLDCPLFLLGIFDLLKAGGCAVKKITDVVWELAEPVVQEHGCQLWDVEYVREAGQWYLRLYLDKDGGVDILDCEAISRRVSDLLDEADPIESSYVFEVGSAGLERQLKRPSDFARFMGSPVLVKTYQNRDGRKEFAGKLAGYEDGAVLLDMGGAEPVRFEKNEVALVRLRVEF